MKEYCDAFNRVVKSQVGADLRISMKRGEGGIIVQNQANERGITIGEFIKIRLGILKSESAGYFVIAELGDLCRKRKKKKKDQENREDEESVRGVLTFAKFEEKFEGMVKDLHKNKKKMEKELPKKEKKLEDECKNLKNKQMGEEEPEKKKELDEKLKKLESKRKKLEQDFNTLLNLQELPQEIEIPKVIKKTLKEGGVEREEFEFNHLLLDHFHNFLLELEVHKKMLVYLKRELNCDDQEGSKMKSESPQATDNRTK